MKLLYGQIGVLLHRSWQEAQATANRLLGGVALVAVFAVIGLLWHASEANRNLFAAQAVVMAIMHHVRDYNAWPRTPEELERVSFAGAYAWPTDSAEIMSRCSIRFDADIRVVATASPENFPYITPKRPIFLGSFCAKVAALIALCREVINPAITGTVLDGKPRGP